MPVSYAGFNEIEIVPKLEGHVGCVYVLIFSKDGIEMPFYVGQTTRFLGRMDDYFWADFQATTDFRVGQAIRYLCEQPGGKVFARYKTCADPRVEEKLLLDALYGSAILLNGKGYNYKTEAENAVAAAVRETCDQILTFAASVIEPEQQAQKAY